MFYLLVISMMHIFFFMYQAHGNSFQKKVMLLFGASHATEVMLVENLESILHRFSKLNAQSIR